MGMITSNRKKWYVFYLLAPIMYGGIIFLLSSISRYPEPLTHLFSFDKLLHLAEYFVLGCLLMRMLTTAPWRFAVRLSWLLTLAIGILYGMGDELHQSFVPGRMASIYDVLFDAAGVICAVLSYELLRSRMPCIQFIEKKIERI